jgi:hypothetical protein
MTTHPARTEAPKTKSFLLLFFKKEDSFFTTGRTQLKRTGKRPARQAGDIT